MMAAVSVFPSQAELGAALARSVAEAAAQAVASSGRFTLGLSGGSLVALLARELPPALRAVPGAEPSRWLLALCDERLVPLEDPDSTEGAYRSQLLSQLPPPGPQLLGVSRGLAPAEAAKDYEERLRQAFPGSEIPQFDLLLLGVGPDGHTCSLFPGHALLQEQHSLISPVLDSPKPPAQRVTMTLPLINSSRSVLVVATGDSKAPVIERILGRQEDEDGECPLPAGRLRPRSGRLRWMLDTAAARGLPQGPGE